MPAARLASSAAAAAAAAAATASVSAAAAAPLRRRGRGASLPDCLYNPPCPHPNWAPTYQLNLSTATEPGITWSYLDAPFYAQWGWVSLDSSVAMGEWISANLSQSTNEEALVEQARRIKAINPRTRVTVYRQMEVALGWQASSRRAMYDPTLADWFAQFTDGQGHKNGTIYNVFCSGCINQTGAYGDQFFWDYRSPGVCDYFLERVAGSVSSGALHPLVDGVFTDDYGGMGDEQPQAQKAMNLTDAEVQAMRDATTACWTRLNDEVIMPNNKFIWQSLFYGDKPRPRNETCAAWMRQWCALDRTYPIFMEYDPTPAGLLQNIAAFLIARGPWWWLGEDWMGAERAVWSDIYNTDVGVPLTECAETSPAVFGRNYSNGYAELDCSGPTWAATLAFGGAALRSSAALGPAGQ